MPSRESVLVSGIVGGLLTGCFAKPDIGGASGLFYGNAEQLGWQIAGILMTSVYSAAGTAIIMLALKFTIGIRVSEDEEDMGLDASEHGYGTGMYSSPFPHYCSVLVAKPYGTTYRWTMYDWWLRSARRAVAKLP